MWAMQMHDHLHGALVYDRDGQQIGQVAEIFPGGRDGDPLAVAVGTGLFAARKVLVPLINAQVGWQRIDVPYMAARVTSAPVMPSSLGVMRGPRNLDQQTAALVSAHYGLVALK